MKGIPTPSKVAVQPWLELLSIIQHDVKNLSERRKLLEDLQTWALVNFEVDGKQAKR